MNWDQNDRRIAQTWYDQSTPVSYSNPYQQQRYKVKLNRSNGLSKLILLLLLLFCIN